MEKIINNIVNYIISYSDTFNMQHFLPFLGLLKMFRQLQISFFHCPLQFVLASVLEELSDGNRFVS